MNQNARIVFAGTPAFAVQALDALLAASYEVVAVYTQPDRPAGRGRRLTQSPVKQLGLARGLSVHQPRSFREPGELSILERLRPDLMVVAAYGLLLPPGVLTLPRHGCINIHASLLPRWRGAAPIQRAILAGDQETGITIMQMDEGLDTGPMLHRRPCRIGDRETAGALHDKLATLGAEALLEVLPRLLAGELRVIAQDASTATYAPKIEKREAAIEWSRSAVEIDRRVRAFNPWPIAQTQYDDQALRIWSADPLKSLATAAPGSVTATGCEGVDVATGDGVLRITTLQSPGKRAMSAAEFLNAHPLDGAVFD